MVSEAELVVRATAALNLRKINRVEGRPLGEVVTAECHRGGQQVHRQVSDLGLLAEPASAARAPRRRAVWTRQIELSGHKL